VTPRPRTARGFTLLEVMVALAILAMGLMALSDVVGAALRNHVRAAHLDQATLLARGKLAQLEDEFEQKGFRDFDQSDEGTFEDQGHREIRWKVEAVKPEVELGPERILQMLTGGQGLELLQQQKGGAQQQDPRLLALTAMIQAQLTQIGEQIKKGVREVRLTVSWPEGTREDSFTVVTHLVVLAPKEGTQ
jgi:general secretion pathway protein I